MKSKVLYIANSIELDRTLEKITYGIPCWVDREFVEMDYSKVYILCRDIDMAWVEDVLAPLV